MSYCMRKHSFFFSSFSFVLVLTVAALIIFGFDINTPKNTRRALINALKNGSTVNYFYRINDESAFGIFTDREPGEMDIIINTYERNMAPYCFFCGWNTANTADKRGILQPYLANGIAYTVEANTEDYGGVPTGEYGTFNLATGEFGHVKDLNEITADPTNVAKRITREYVSENFDEMSFASSDDEDCQIVFSALFVCYVVLLIWGGVIALRSRKS